MELDSDGENVKVIISVDSDSVAMKSDLPEEEEVEFEELDLDDYQTKLTAGQGITIDSDGTISAEGKNYTAGNGIDITNDVISVDSDSVAMKSDLPDEEEVEFEELDLDDYQTKLTAGQGITIDSDGTISATGGGGSGEQANWAETDSDNQSYIQNKPQPKTLTAGQGINISETASTLTISCTASSTVDQTYNAESTNAQSGVAVAEAIGDLPSNLTAAQFQALKEALGVDETVLWEGTLNTLNSDVSCSESIYNFERIKVFYRLVADNTVQGVGVYEFEPSEISSANFTSFGAFYLISNGWYGWWLCRLAVTDSNKIKITKTENSWGNGESPTSSSVDSSTVGYIYKIVGIHRIASNQGE
jgi:hypothetical protein